MLKNKVSSIRTPMLIQVRLERTETNLMQLGTCHKSQKPQAPTPQAPTPQAPIRNSQTRKVANAKGPNLKTNLT